jgi:CRP/FNR family transcriptional regulator, nitrogen oxide reductase regulator
MRDGRAVQRSSEARGGSHLTVSLDHLSARIALVQRCSLLFTGLSQEACVKILALAHEKTFERRETLFWDGDPIHEVLLLIGGCTKVSQVGRTGNEVILRLNGPGDLVGALGFLSRRHHCASAQALHDCKVLAWDATVFDGICERFPLVRRNAANILAEHLHELEERFREVATEKVGVRVAHELVRLLKQIGCRVNGAVEINLSREDLAQLTGTTLFTVSRLLSEWEQRGFVVPLHQAVQVRDARALQEIVGDE